MSGKLSSAERARIETSFAQQTLMRTFGAELAEVSRGRCRIVAPILRIALQQQGAGHAGLTFALGDVAAGYAALSLLPPDREVMTVEMKINLTAPAIGERLVATGEVVRAGRRLSVVRAEVVAESGGRSSTVAILQGTMIPVDLR